MRKSEAGGASIAFSRSIESLVRFCWLVRRHRSVKIDSIYSLGWSIDQATTMAASSNSLLAGKLNFNWLAGQMICIASLFKKKLYQDRFGFD